MDDNILDIDKWKAAYFKELSETDWNKAYFLQTERSARETLLKQRIATGEESEELDLITELFKHRYTPEPKEPDHIDHAIRGMVNIPFLPETKKSFLKKKNFQRDLDQIMNDLGIPISEKYGTMGQDIMFEELCNIVRKFIQLCREDKQYNAVLLGFGRIKPTTQSWKVARNLADLVIRVPKFTGTENEFMMLAGAARKVFEEEFPKTSEDFALAEAKVLHDI